MTINKKIYKSAIFLIIILFLSVSAFSARRPKDASSEYERTKKNLQEDKESLDEKSKRLINERLRMLYHPPFHIGLSFGMGFTGVSLPKGYNSEPNLSYTAAIEGTNYFSKNFAIYFAVGWNRFKGYFDDDNGSSTDYLFDYLTIQVAPLLFYKDAILFAGPILGININDERTGSYPRYEMNPINIGIFIGGGYRINFLYRIRMHISLEFRYFFMKYMDAVKSAYKPYSLFIKLSILYGIGAYPKE